MGDLSFRPVTEEDCFVWQGERVVYGPNAKGVGKQLETVVTEQGVVVPLVLDEITLAELAQGKTLWLMVYGHQFPPVCLTTGPGGEWT